MELQLKNIGMIKEATVKIDGLTVIAGENDTGKSTVGKALFLHLKYLVFLKKLSLIEKDTELKNKVYNDLKKDLSHSNILVNLIFSKQLSDDGNIKLTIGDKYLNLLIKNNQILYDDFLEKGLKLKNDIFFPIMIETPLVWNFNKFFNQLALIESRLSTFGDKVEIERPFLLEDIHFKLLTNNENDNNNFNIEGIIKKIIDGSFKEDDLGNFFFERNGNKIELANTATGIKAFGILQILSKNNYLNKDTVLILDEPEVHLHPKWQLEMAKIIVDLVKNDVKIVVNSHSPYMIEALELYSQKYNINRNFYLAQKKDDYAIIDDVTDNLESIYAKLAKPIQTLEEQSLENFKW